MIDIETLREEIAKSIRVVKSEKEWYVALRKADSILQFLADEGMGFAEEVEMPSVGEDNPFVRLDEQANILNKVGKLIKFTPLK